MSPYSRVITSILLSVQYTNYWLNYLLEVCKWNYWVIAVLYGDFWDTVHVQWENCHEFYNTRALHVYVHCIYCLLLPQGFSKHMYYSQFIWKSAMSYSNKPILAYHSIFISKSSETYNSTIHSTGIYRSLPV